MVADESFAAFMAALTGEIQRRVRERALLEPNPISHYADAMGALSAVCARAAYEHGWGGEEDECAAIELAMRAKKEPV